MKKIISILVMILSLIINSSYNCLSETYSEGYYNYEIEDGGIVIIEYFGDESEIYIPSSITGLPVFKIKKGCFDKTSAVTVHLPDTVIEIEEGAFVGKMKILVNYNDYNHYVENDLDPCDPSASEKKEDGLDLTDESEEYIVDYKESFVEVDSIVETDSIVESDSMIDKEILNSNIHEQATNKKSFNFMNIFVVALASIIIACFMHRVLKRK